MKAHIISIAIALFFTSNLPAQCMASLDAPSEITNNPVGDISGKFQFDYYIQSKITFSVDGQAMKMDGNYYVNTADGSMFFPQGFFLNNFGQYENRRGKLDGAIWLSNGQMVTYVYDKKNNQKRAITSQIDQTSQEISDNQFLKSQAFFKQSYKLSPHLGARPGLGWNNVEGYKAVMDTGMEGETMIMYFDKKGTAIKTNRPMIGFFVGVLKDTQIKKCNRLAVYTKVSFPNSTDFISVELISIEKIPFHFSGEEYKPATIGGAPNTLIRMQMRQMERQLLRLHEEIEEYKRLRKTCKAKGCDKMYDEKIEYTKQEIQDLECEAARLMGLEDTMEECK